MTWQPTTRCDYMCHTRSPNINLFQVAMKLFVDNVCRQVIERHILARLPGIFDPVSVSAYEDEALLDLALESANTRHRRAEALQLQEALEKSLRDLGN